MIKCFLLDTSLLDYFWGEAFNIATYLRNHLGTKDADKTLFELWNGSQPNYITPKGVRMKSLCIYP